MASALTGAEGALETVMQETSAFLATPQEAALSDTVSDDISPSNEDLIVEVNGAGSLAFDTISEQEIRSAAPVSLSTSTRIASAIAHPLAALNIDHAQFGPISLHDLQAISQHPFFSSSVNRAAAELAGLSKIAIDKSHLRRLGHSSASQIALLLATGDPELAEQASLLLGAIVLHKHLLARALKAEREQLQQLLGEDIYRIATREAPVLHASMAELDDGSFSMPAAFATNPVEAGKTGLRIIAVGQRVLHDFVSITEPLLSPLLGFRQPAQPVSESNQLKTTVMTDRHSVHIIRLLRRRFEPWLHTIA